MAYEYLFDFIFDYSIFNICSEKMDVLFSISFQLKFFLSKIAAHSHSKKKCNEIV